MRTCRICHTKYTPVRPLQPCCDSFQCKVAYANRVVEKARSKRLAEDRKALKVRKEAAKRRGDLMAEAQAAFNAFIRWRDRDTTCICCGKPFEPQKPGGSMDCGHYLSRGSAPHLRFNEDNAFGQRKNCNRPGGTTRAAFRAGVIARIGLERVESIESDQSSPKWSHDDLRAIRDEYRRRLKELKER